MIDFERYEGNIHQLKQTGFVLLKDNSRVGDIEFVAGSTICLLSESPEGQALVYINKITPFAFVHYFKKSLEIHGSKFKGRQNTACPLAVVEGSVRDNQPYIWHDDHYDVWKGSFEPFMKRITDLPVIRANSLPIVPIMYVVTYEDLKLLHCIIGADTEITKENYSIVLPKYSEVSFSLSGDVQTIIPTANWHYGKVVFEAYRFVSVDKSGTVSGRLAKSIVTSELEIQAGVTVYVRADGTTYAKVLENAILKKIEL